MSSQFPFEREYRENSVIYAEPMTSHKLLKQQFLACYAKYKKRTQTSWFGKIRFRGNSSRKNNFRISSQAFMDQVNSNVSKARRNRHRINLLRKLCTTTTPNDMNTQLQSSRNHQHYKSNIGERSTSKPSHTTHKAPSTSHGSNYWSIGISQKYLDDGSHEPPVLDEDPVFDIENALRPEVATNGSCNVQQATKSSHSSSPSQSTTCNTSSPSLDKDGKNTKNSDDDGDDLIIVSEVDQNLKLSFWDIKRVVKCIVNNTMHNDVEQVNQITLDQVLQRLKHLYHRDFTDRIPEVEQCLKMAKQKCMENLQNHKEVRQGLRNVDLQTLQPNE